MITIPDGMRRPAEVERDELKKQLAEARAEIERLKTLVIDCTDWNWLDEDAFDNIPENITDATDAIVKERLNIGG